MEIKLPARLAAAVLIALGLAGGALPPPAAAQNQDQTRSDAAPVIDDLEVNADAGLAPGSRLAFTVRGTPRSKARVQVADSTLDLPLREAAPGVYEGSYTVRRADRIHPTALIRANLAKGNLSSSASFSFPPSFLAHQQPAPGPAREPAARVPAPQPPATPTEARIDRFAMAPVDRIEPGTELQFTLDGAPGARATIDLHGLPNAVALRELRPGHYVGKYTVRRQDAIEQGPAVALLRSGGRTVTAKLAMPSLAAAAPASGASSMGAAAAAAPGPDPIPPLELQVTSPEPNGAVDGGQVVVQGRTAPHASVQVRVDAVPPATGGRLSVAQSVTQQSIQADASGNFSFNFTAPAAVPGTRFEVLLSARQGTRITPEQRLLLFQRQG